MSGLPAVEAAKARQRELERIHTCIHCGHECITYLGDGVECFHRCRHFTPSKVVQLWRTNPNAAEPSASPQAG